jgi:hypothetical protein
MLGAVLFSVFFGGAGGPEAPPASEEPLAAQSVHHVSWNQLRLPCTFQTEGAAAVVGLRLWWTLDDGNSWDVLPPEGTMKTAKVIDFTAPHDGRYGFWLQAVDEVGHTSPEPGTGDEPTMVVVVDTKPPAIDVLSPGDHKGFMAGQVVELSWQVHDANLPEAPVRIAYVEGNSDTPVPIEGEHAGYPAQGTVRWPVPLVDATVSFVFSCRDRAGNTGEARRGPFDVSHAFTPEGKKGVVAETLSRHRVLPVFYRFSEIDPEDVGAVELYWCAADYVAGETEWRHAATDDDDSSPVMFRAPRDGLFGLAVAVKAKDGESYVRPLGSPGDADVVTLVDTHDPQVEVVAVNGAATESVWVQAGGTVGIDFVVREQNLPEQAGALEYSLDQGESWHPLVEGLRVTANKPFTYTWAVPFITSEHFLIRVCATDRVGRKGYAVFPGKIQIRDAGALSDVDAAKLIRRSRIRLGRGNQKDVLEAVKLLNTAVGFAPENAEAHHALAKAYVLAGNRTDALPHLRTAVELVPGDAAYRIELVELLLEGGRSTGDGDLVREARSHLEQVSLEGLYLRSDFWLMNGKYRAAEEALADRERSRAERLEEEKK